MRSLFLLFCASCASLRPSLPILFASFACFAGHLAAQPANVQADPTTGALFRPAAATFISGNSLLTTSGAAAAYQPLDAELAAISGLSSNGLIARTSSSTAAARILTGTAGQITVTNGDGVSGNPTLSLPTALTSVNSVTAATTTDLTLSGGSSGASLVLGQGASGAAAFTLPGSGGVTATQTRNGQAVLRLTNASTGTGAFANLELVNSGFTGSLYQFGTGYTTSGRFVADSLLLDSGGTGGLAFGATNGNITWYQGGNTATMRLAATTGNLLIGGTTDISGTGGLKVFGTTASTSTTTGSLVNAGGFGNTGAAYIGGLVSTGSRFVFTGPGAVPGASELAIGTNGVGTRILYNVPTGGEFNFTVNGTTVTAINATTGLYTTGLINSTNTTASTSTTTGSLVNAGGFGNAGAAHIGGIVHGHAGQSVQSVLGSLTPSFFSGHANGTTSNVLMSGNTTRCMGIQAYTDGSNTGYWSLGFQGNPTFVEGLRVFAGLAGVGVGVVSIPSTTASTSTTTGALVVGSNVGLSGNSGGANWFGGERLISQMNQNAPTRLQVRNDTSGTAAQAQVSATLGDFTTYTAMGSLSAGFTTSGLFAANAGYIASNATAGLNVFTVGATSLTLGTNGTAALTLASNGAATFSNSVRSTSATAGIGYATGAGGAVTQITSRTTGVTLNTVSGAITLFTAAGSATWQSFTVTNSAVAATDTIIVNQRSGTDLYMMSVTAVGAGSFRISFATTGGTTSEAPVFNFSVIKAVSS